MAEVEDHGCCEFVQVHFIQILYHLGIGCLGKLHELCVEDWVVLDIRVALEVGDGLEDEQQVEVVEGKDLALVV